MSTTLGQLEPGSACQRLRSADGLSLHMGPFVANLRSPLKQVATAVEGLYADYPIAAADAFTDFHVGVKRPKGLRSLWKPQVVFELDGHEPFNPCRATRAFHFLNGA